MGFETIKVTFIIIMILILDRVPMGFETTLARQRRLLPDHFRSRPYGI